MQEMRWGLSLASELPPIETTIMGQLRSEDSSHRAP